MEKKAVKLQRLYYMDYIHEGRWTRSREYDSLTAFTAKCGQWCDENPGLYRLHWRDRYVDAM